MDDILNKIGIPNDIGVVLSCQSLVNCFSKKELGKNFLNIYKKEFNKLLENYGIDENMFMTFKACFCIEVKDNKKILKVNELMTIASIYEYFNFKLEINGEKLIWVQDYDKYVADEMIKLKSFIKTKINDLKKVESLEDLKEISVPLYNSYLNAFNEQPSDGMLWNWDLWFKNEISDDIKKFTKFNLWIKEFISDTCKPINMDLFNDIDEDKFKLYLASQYLNLSVLFKEPTRSVLIDMAIKYIDSIETNVIFDELYLFHAAINLETEDLFWDFYKHENITKEKIKKEIENLLLEYPIISENLNAISNYNYDSFRDYNYNDVFEYIDEVINQVKQNGAENVETSEIESKINQLEEEIKICNLSEKEYLEKKHQLQKLNMVLKEIKPKAIQKGLGVFKDFYVYYYPNGMVAIDKIEYGARLFVMPISVYKNVINMKSLRAIGKLPGVKAFNHDDRTDWLNNAKKIILNGNEMLVEEDLKIADAISSFDFPFNEEECDKLINDLNNSELYTDKTQKEKELLRQETEKRKKKIKKSKDIDNELKQSNPLSYLDMNGSDRSEINDCENDLNEKFGDEADFQELYNEVKANGKKYKRNPAVAKYTKDRTKDANGNYCCEMCGNKYWNTKRLQSHHVIPISQNGPDNIYNTICLCTDCHTIIHLEPELVTKNVKSKLLLKLKKHILEDTPEYLEQFNELFMSYNDKLNLQRSNIRKELEQDILITKNSNEFEKEEMIQKEIDSKIKQYEERLSSEYNENSNISDELFEIDWHNANVKK